MMGGNYRCKMRNAERIRRASDSDLLDGAEAGGGYLDALDLLDAGMGMLNRTKGNVQTPEYTPGDTGLEPVRTMKFEGLNDTAHCNKKSSFSISCSQW